MRRLCGLLLSLAVIGCQTAPPPTPEPSAQPSPAPTAPPTATPTPTPSPSPTPTPTPSPTQTPAFPTGGTLYLLLSTLSANGGVGFQDMDPERIYTGEDLAFFGATLFRSLTAYQYSPDPLGGTTLVPDAATDTGTPNADATQWSFTLREGMKWQDGSAVTCADFKYGVSRSFATEIHDGPTYAISYLDIPADQNAENGSQYPGPYRATAAQRALFDAAVECDGNTITFHLNQSVPDFNYTVALGFGAVPNPVDHPVGSMCSDTRGDYATAPCSDGPYVVQSYIPGQGGSLVLVRNPYWTREVDDYRGAYPDKWEVDFGIDPAQLDQRLMQPTGSDQFALAYAPMQSNNLDTVFSDAHTAAADFAGRAFSDYGANSRYIWIRTDKVTNPLIRQAIAVALDREAIRLAYGGEFAGDFADGVIGPDIGIDYAPTHLWDAQGPFGEAVPTTGDPTLARQLIQQSGEPAPTLTYDYLYDAPIPGRIAKIVQRSLREAGVTVLLNPYFVRGPACGPLNPDCQHEFGEAHWGPDWPNASTVIPPLFTPESPQGWEPSGDFDLSRVSSDNDPQFEAMIQDARTTMDRQDQAAKWQVLDQYAADQVFAIPTLWGLTQTIAGTGVGNLYRWPAYSSWPYGQLYVKH